MCSPRKVHSRTKFGFVRKCEPSVVAFEGIVCLVILRRASAGLHFFRPDERFNSLVQQDTAHSLRHVGCELRIQLNGGRIDRRCGLTLALVAYVERRLIPQ
jgi:hypothetical protein